MRMQKLRLGLTAMVLSAAAAAMAAQPGPPSDESIRKIFEVTHLSSLLDIYMTQMKASVHAGMQQAMAGKPLNDRQKKIMDDMGDKMVALMQEQLDWPSLEAQIVQIYRETFTQKDVDAMLTFYRSPTGQKAIAKQPQVMQQMSQYAMGRMKDLVPKLQELVRDTAAQLKAAGSDSPAPDAAAPTDEVAPAAQAPADSPK